MLRPLSCRFKAQAPECKVIIVTALRNPVARLLSQALSDKLPIAQFGAFARAQANFQTKYLLFSTDWRVSSLFEGNSTVEESLLEPAQTLLSYTELVGRTEELIEFLVAVDATMGWTDEAFASSRSTLHDGHRAKKRWNLTGAQGWHAQRYNAIDIKLYNSFCRTHEESVTPLPRRTVQELCSDEGGRSRRPLPTLPHYFASGHVSKQEPKPSQWQMVFDGRACHGFNLGDEYAMHCDDQVHPTIGSTLGKVAGYHREKSGKLTPCVVNGKPTKSCTSTIVRGRRMEYKI